MTVSDRKVWGYFPIFFVGVISRLFLLFHNAFQFKGLVLNLKVLYLFIYDYRVFVFINAEFERVLFGDGP